MNASRGRANIASVGRQLDCFSIGFHAEHENFATQRSKLIHSTVSRSIGPWVELALSMQLTT